MWEDGDGSDVVFSGVGREEVASDKDEIEREEWVVVLWEKETRKKSQWKKEVEVEVGLSFGPSKE